MGSIPMPPANRLDSCNTPQRMEVYRDLDSRSPDRSRGVFVPDQPDSDGWNREAGDQSGCNSVRRFVPSTGTGTMERPAGWLAIGFLAEIVLLSAYLSGSVFAATLLMLTLWNLPGG